MDVTIEKVGRKTKIKTATAHPTWVSRTPKGTYSPEGYELYKYQTYILEDFIQGGKYRDKLDEGDQGESGHGLPRNEGTCSLGLASEWKGIEHGRKCELDSAWDSRIDGGDLGNQISDSHPPQAKAEKLGMEHLSFVRKTRKKV